MARPSDGPTPRETLVAFRLTDAEVALLDKQRGADSRSAYLRTLIHRDTPTGKAKK